MVRLSMVGFASGHAYFDPHRNHHHRRRVWSRQRHLVRVLDVRHAGPAQGRPDSRDRDDAGDQQDRPARAADDRDVRHRRPLPVAGHLGRALMGNTSAAYLLGGAVLYIVGTVLVTGGGNEPLNHKLDKFHAHAADAADRWNDFYTKWLAWNHVRLVTTVAATALFAVALVRGR
jgi:Domain of unknown function (DUF1772)